MRRLVAIALVIGCAGAPPREAPRSETAGAATRSELDGDERPAIPDAPPCDPQPHGPALADAYARLREAVRERQTAAAADAPPCPGEDRSIVTPPELWAPEVTHGAIAEACERLIDLTEWARRCS